MRASFTSRMSTSKNDGSFGLFNIPSLSLNINEQIDKLQLTLSPSRCGASREGGGQIAGWYYPSPFTLNTYMQAT